VKQKCILKFPQKTTHFPCFRCLSASLFCGIKEEVYQMHIKCKCNDVVWNRGKVEIEFRRPHKYKLIVQLQRVEAEVLCDRLVEVLTEKSEVGQKEGV
jgi:hypothetical protein